MGGCSPWPSSPPQHQGGMQNVPPLIRVMVAAVSNGSTETLPVPHSEPRREEMWEHQQHHRDAGTTLGIYSGNTSDKEMFPFGKCARLWETQPK